MNTCGDVSRNGRIAIFCVPRMRALGLMSTRVSWAAFTGLLLLPNARANGQLEQMMWRTPERDGINCLYVLLSLEGRSVDYRDLSQSLECGRKRPSLAALQRAAYCHGLSTRMYTCSPHDVLKKRRPVIAHMQGPNGDHGFVLLFGLNESKCNILNGGMVTISQISTDEFRRHWTGYALAPTSSQHSWMPLVIGGSLVIVYLYSRKKRHTVEGTRRAASV